jgi:hypothetical protein
MEQEAHAERHELTRALDRLAGRAMVSAYKSVTISPKTHVFSMTLQQGVSIPVEEGETIEAAQARAEELVDAAVLKSMEDAKKLCLADPKLQGGEETIRARMDARPSTQEAHNDPPGGFCVLRGAHGGLFGPHPSLKDLWAAVVTSDLREGDWVCGPKGERLFVWTRTQGWEAIHSPGKAPSGPLAGVSAPSATQRPVPRKKVAP